MARRLIWANGPATILPALVLKTTKTPFHIKVKDCPASVTTVAVLFDGARDQSDNSLLAINGGASGVAIKLYEHDRSTAVSLGKNVSQTDGHSGYQRRHRLCRPRVLRRLYLHRGDRDGR
ncbi:fimbrial protein [Klebsiella pneumoniae subsp. ozaenae]|uniref:Fimbrial protein n=1 Tax=Klebsiella pneumoniae subsp. ozaenae TaxID=574 RepID=A0A377Z7S1_KLEPO|nr:fimbrial protein [Klebsiella pneumoniae subsp. ozaenae]